MAESLLLDLPAVTMDGTAASCDANRKSYDPFADLNHGGILPYGFRQLAGDSFVIDQVLRSWQPMGTTPPNSEGRVALFVDVRGMYDKEVAFVAGVENGHPRGLLPLAKVEWLPYSRPPFIMIEPPLIGPGKPFTFRKGWRLCVAPETNGNFIGVDALQAFFGIGIAGWDGVDLDDGVVHAMPLTSSATWAEGPKRSYRGIIPVKAGGTRARLRFASRGDGLSIAHASIGIRTGAVANMTATPAQLAFGGAAGLSLPASSYAECDDVTITIPDDSEIVVDVNVTGNWAFKLKAGAASGIKTYWTDTASWNSAAQIGSPTLQDGMLHCVDCVKVWAP